MYNNLKIGYVPYLSDLSHPDDRRRFPYFAKRNNLDFEIADKNKFYDIILLPAPSNLSQWLIYKKRNPKTRFIFEMVDSLIFPFDTFTTLFKGVGRFMIGKETMPYLDYKRLLIKWLKVADLVICSSTEIKKAVEKWNKNVLVSLDYLEHEYKFLKTDYSIKGKMKLVWEGQGVVLRHLLHFKEVFNQVSSFCELHIITSEKYPLYGNLINRKVETILEQLPIDTIFHKWDINKNREILSGYDCAVIPLNRKHIFGWHKPANKLISFWFTGLPTLVSDTPAYTELMIKTGEDLHCSNINEWVSKIHRIRDMKTEERETLAKKNYNFAKNYYSDDEHDLIWVHIFESLHLSQPKAHQVMLPDFSLSAFLRSKLNLSPKPSFT
jgi:hypothetical protein